MSLIIMREWFKYFVRTKAMLAFTLMLLIFSNCSKEQFNAERPSYLHISSINLQTEVFQGTDSHKITDAWVNMDGQFLGVFELPATIPILAEGFHDFTIYPGIKANGISATRIRNPFLGVCVLNSIEPNTPSLDTNRIHLYRDQVVSVNATTYYSAETEFLMIEDYEDDEAALVLSLGEDSSDVMINSEVFLEGDNSSLVVTLDAENPFFEMLSSELVSLDKLYKPTMLELNYRCDQSFKVGLVVKSPASDFLRRYESLQVNPSIDWNKIYVHMTNQVVLANSSDEFGIYIRAHMSDTSETASFHFDNIKWLHINNE